jgi:hydrogenase maturation protein HypF
LLDSKGNEVHSANPLKEAAKLLKEGRTLAVKGIGGLHLMCDAENSEAVADLRRRKGRPHKPLAVMAADLEAVEQQCVLNGMEKQLLSSAKAPIVLLQKKQGVSLPDILAPDTDRLGIMLPYTPLHLLLFAEGLKYLVATSGNISGMPIQYDNEKALSGLSDTADYFLMHNRDINIPVDDSVTKTFQGRELLSRIGRGYAPLVIGTKVKRQIVALGAEQKSSISISTNGYVHTSQYLGDIKSPESYENYKHVLDNLISLLKVKPEVYVHDLHPYYMSTQYAEKQQVQKLAIQHHFAHMLLFELI